MTINSGDLDKLLRDHIDTAMVGCAYHVNGTDNNRVDYLPEATEADRVLGEKIATGFEQAAIDVDGNTITAMVDKSDTDVVFSAFGSDGSLQEQVTVAAVAGVGTYELDLTPGLYRVRAYGTISFMSGFVEAMVT